MKKFFVLILIIALAVIFIPCTHPARAAEITAVTDSDTFATGSYVWSMINIKITT
ncbi:MAG: hypothetical protein A4E55_01936 [Pelotomaculum sp. PtaU1.Bin035]|nr:MAG: hypothetical protein A4E55_01936 [Pelotomaculum sp. PtaU1.Bin035]